MLWKIVSAYSARYCGFQLLHVDVLINVLVLLAIFAHAKWRISLRHWGSPVDLNLISPFLIDIWRTSLYSLFLCRLLFCLMPNGIYVISKRASAGIPAALLQICLKHHFSKAARWGKTMFLHMVLFVKIRLEMLEWERDNLICAVSLLTVKEDGCAITRFKCISSLSLASAPSKCKFRQLFVVNTAGFCKEKFETTSVATLCSLYWASLQHLQTLEGRSGRFFRHVFSVMPNVFAFI